MKLTQCVPISVLSLSLTAMAAPPPVTGGALQPLRSPDAAPAPPPKFDVQPGSAPSPVESETDVLKIVVKSLQVTGSQAFPEADLIAITGFKPGTALTLGELRSMALKITKYYQENGYPVAQAYLPAQDISDGAVTITVTEGRYGKILVRNQTNIAGAVITDLMEGLSVGDTVRSAPLQSHLLLLSDLPGIQLNSTLVPGTAYGTTDLLVDVLPGRRVTGSIDADNAGNFYTGANNIGATISLNEPAGQGDVATLRVLTSGEGLNYFRASYQLQVGKARVGAAYSSLEYSLGKDFESLLANGTAKITSFYGNYPLIRSPNRNLYAGLAYDNKRFQDRMDSVGSVVDKTARVLIASVSGDHRDSWGGGADNSYSLTLTSGTINILTAGSRAFDAAAAQSNGRFNKLGFSANRLQRVGPSLALYAGIRGQFASKNLDISEKMELGGMGGVRAYPEGEAFGDQGYLITLEARYPLPQGSLRLPGQMQLIGFVDAGTVKLNAKPWTLESNQRTLSAMGVGLNWWVSSDFVVQAMYAHKLGAEPARSAPDASGRFWLRAVKYF
ncbi:MAG: polypeptide-transport-associated domain-containing protein [Comamonadaceae bacterium]|nr:MAG: polypeptide-transport-associated domain-containing protein [Comamonadaceae bacterium]